MVRKNGTHGTPGWCGGVRIDCTGGTYEWYAWYAWMVRGGAHIWYGWYVWMVRMDGAGGCAHMVRVVRINGTHGTLEWYALYAGKVRITPILCGEGGRGGTHGMHLWRGVWRARRWYMQQYGRKQCEGEWRTLRYTGYGIWYTVKVEVTNLYIILVWDEMLLDAKVPALKMIMILMIMMIIKLSQLKKRIYKHRHRYRHHSIINQRS